MTCSYQIKASHFLPGAVKNQVPIIFYLLLIFISLPAIAMEQINTKPLTWQEPGTGMIFIKITGGCFMMGQSAPETDELIKEAGIGLYERFYADELPRHRVCVYDFWLGKYEVTNKEWKKVMGKAPLTKATGDKLPIQKISFTMATDFALRLSDMTQKISFRMPSEAEWEYAARAGSSKPFSFGDTASSSLANYNATFIYGSGGLGEYRRNPLPVGSLPANAFGLHDMHGNMWEWCADWYESDYYQHSPPNNPPGPKAGSLKVMRGGSWFVAPRSMRSANRNGVKPDKAVKDFGLRLVVTFSRQTPILSDFDQDF